MKPTRSRRSSVSSVSVIVLSSLPSRTTEPDVGWSSPAAHCSSVLLPEPDGPMIAVNVPRPNCVVTSSSATTWLPRLP